MRVNLRIYVVVLCRIPLFVALAVLFRTSPHYVFLLATAYLQVMRELAGKLMGDMPVAAAGARVGAHACAWGGGGGVV